MNVTLRLRKRIELEPGEATSTTFYHVRDVYENYGVINVYTQAGYSFRFLAADWTWDKSATVDAKRW